MSSITAKPKILFVINKGSGNNSTDFEELIAVYFEDKPDFAYTTLLLDNEIDCDNLRAKIIAEKPNKVVAVGGDGTIKLLAEVLMGTGMPLGILPAGSANGMAKDLNIPTDYEPALDLICSKDGTLIHLIEINGQLCIHLSDIGFNAYVVKVFDSMKKRGMWSYIKAAWRVLWKHAKMKATFEINNKTVEREAVMIVLANGLSYGTGVTINPEGKLDDDVFEIIIVRKISVMELLKMRFSKLPFNPEKTELFRTKSISIKSKKKVHFQIDGEYLGKTNAVTAKILPKAVRIIY